MEVADREWRLIREEAWPGPMNMALDEVAARTAASGGPRTLRVYRWRPSTLSLGYNQDPDSVDWAFCEREGVSVTRRPTGGGGIYHDEHGDISYSIVLPAEEQPGDLMESYHLLCGPVFEAFDRMGVDAGFVESEVDGLYHPSCYLRALHPAHDVVAGGRKLSGNAQHRTRDAVVQHGSLSFDLVPRKHLGVFADPGVSREAFRERVTGIHQESGIDREAAVAALEGALADWAEASVGDWTDEELDAARALAAEKYGSDAWNRDREDPTG